MEVTLNQHIEITPGVRGGKPRIVGTRMTVADLATLYLRMGQSLDLIAGKYYLPLASVYAGLDWVFIIDRTPQVATGDRILGNVKGNRTSHYDPELDWTD